MTRWRRPSPESRRMPAVHFCAQAPADDHDCGPYDTICGVMSYMLDRWASSAWWRVTCRRCLRSQLRRRLDRELVRRVS